MFWHFQGVFVLPHNKLFILRLIGHIETLPFLRFPIDSPGVTYTVHIHL